MAPTRKQVHPGTRSTLKGPGTTATPALKAKKSAISRKIESTRNPPSSTIAFSDPVLARIENDAELRKALNVLKDRILTEGHITNCKSLSGLPGKSGKLKLPNGDEVSVMSAHATGESW